LWRGIVRWGSRATNFGADKASKPPEYLKVLDRLGSELAGKPSTAEPGNSLKILYGPSFGIYPPCFIHDRLLAYALRLRSAEVIPMYCDGIQSVECNYFGGVWGGERFLENCKHCQAQSQRLWADSPVKPLTFSFYAGRSQIDAIDSEIEKLDPATWAEYEKNGLPIGAWAKDILVNNFVVGDFHLIPRFNVLGIAHLRNLLLLESVYSRILEEVQPDRVVANDSFYGMWAILQELCKRKGIPFYSHWSGTRRGAWCYAMNDAAMNLDLSKAWPEYSKAPLDARRRQKAEDWFVRRTHGKDMLLDTASLGKHQNIEFDFNRLDAKKPTALLTANVIWDLAALNKQALFSDMIDWIAETVQWFRVNPEYQLIVKPHPGEEAPSIPATKETVETGLMIRNVEIPPNVFLLSPKSKVAVYELLPLIRVGLVHTTTVGIEMAAQGIPVITTGHSPYRGFGFTLDPASPTEYFELLQKVLEGTAEFDAENARDLACKFTLFYNYHYYIKLDVMDFTWGKEPRLKIRSLEDLLPGGNPLLDFVLDSIAGGIPIVSENRWPPES